MATVKPFRGVRPPRDKVGLVASRSYQDYPEAERNAHLEFNPFSFLHIINPGYRFQKEISGVQRFSMVKNRYLEFKESNIFIQDQKPSFYIYKIKTRNHVFCGILAGVSTEDYFQQYIKKHEKTIERRKKLFKDYLKTVGFNAEPVLLTYKDRSTINDLIEVITSEVPEYEFTTADRITHELWKVDQDEHVTCIQDEFKKTDALYIADGHHRSASSYLLSEELKAENSSHNGQEPYNYFMSYLIPETQLKIYEFNRMVSDLNNLSKEEFLIALDKWFRIENRGAELYKPSKKHHFSMYLEGEFYSLYLRKSIYPFSNTLSSLDTQILYETVLKPILGIKDLKKNRRISYGYGKHNIIEMKNLIDAKKFAVGFSLLPVTVEEMKNIADEQLQMPPKSTYIEPKLRSGIVIYEF